MWINTLNEMKKESGKTIEEISDQSGVPKGTLNKIFAGQTKDPKYTTLKQIVNCLGYTVDDLERIDTKKSPEPVVIDSEEVQECEKWLTDLLVSKGYIKPGEDISDRDADFLIHWIGLLDAWIAGNG